MTMSEGRSRPVGRGWAVDPAARGAVFAAHDLEALRDTAALKQVTDFAAALCDVPIATIELAEETRRTVLTASGAEGASALRVQSLFLLAADGDDMVVVPDAGDDPRLAGHPSITGDPGVRFYACAPLVSETGVRLGALCVIDTVPRPEGLTPLQRQGLAVLAEGVMTRLRDTRHAAASRHAEHDARRALGDSESRFHILADTMPQMVWSTLADGYHDYFNARWYEFTGVPAGSTDGENWNGIFHPDDQDRAWAVWRHSLTTGEPYQIEYRLRHSDGTYRWVLGRALPIRDAEGRITRWFGTCTDIHEQKMAADEREVISQELSHRIKNIFAVISGLITFAARARPEFAELAADLRDRVIALGRAHDFVRPHSLDSRPSTRQDSLHGLLGQLFEPYRQRGDRVVIEGQDVTVDDRSATPLALLFHELATNAMKYGALSSADGQVTVTTQVKGDTVALIWREQGGTRDITPAETSGFGTQLIELSAVRQLGGKVTRDWLAEGLSVTIDVPAASFSRR